MALLREVTPRPNVLLRQVAQFKTFLRANPSGERKRFLPFFGERAQLCAYLGNLNSAVRFPTHIATEFPLWADFACDLVAGSIRDQAFVCIEFEDADQKSLFRQQRKRRNSHWGTRTEHAVSQINDWLFRISREDGSDILDREFGARHLKLMGVVVVGRSKDVGSYDRTRLDWRSQNTVVGGTTLWIITYDDLLMWLQGRVELLRLKMSMASKRRKTRRANRA
jgi:hypothetical protein